MARKLPLTSISGTKGGPPATHAQIAAFEFKSIKALRAMDAKQRMQRGHELIESLRGFLVIAGEIVSDDKAELITKVRTQYHVFGELLMDLAHAADRARTVLETITAAEARLAVALANIEPDDDEPGGR
jgi:hypothetical protein